MHMNYLNTSVVAITAAVVFFAGTAEADSVAGKQVFDEACADCHVRSSLQGTSPREFSATVRAIVAGTHMHEAKLTLTEAQIADLSAYLAGGGK